jgi:CheY-like chemotaxis protein
LPPTIPTDETRLQQVLKNLLSNAFKFTSKGHVELKITPARSGWTSGHSSLSRAREVVAFAVTDTGIGIPEDKQRVIFEAFQQADGTTSRKYGGTGLGLSISRELASLLGGEIKVHSVVGQGSTFVIYLPMDQERAGAAGNGEDKTAQRFRTAPTPGLERPSPQPAEISGRLVPEHVRPVEDDRHDLRENDRVILVVEDDSSFRHILVDLAHEKGFKVLGANSGRQARRVLREHKVDAVTLDIRLPDTSGWALLDELKHDAATRHIPVQVISVEDESIRSQRQGVVAFVNKPATRDALEDAFVRLGEAMVPRVKNVLVVESDPEKLRAITEVVEADGVVVKTASSGSEALNTVQSGSFDCIVLSRALSDMRGLDLAEQIETAAGRRQPPIVLYTDRDLEEDEQRRLGRLSGNMVLKQANSLDRLLDEVSLFLHYVEAVLPESKRRMLQHVRKADDILAGKRALIVDDDMRNIFALTSILENHKIEPLSAENGRDAIEMLQKDPNIDIVLMDVMMPEMDGYETMRKIRQMRRFQNLPVIGITAKAMPEDRDKCIEAGASDYLAKPIDATQLVSLMRIWLYR